MENAFLYLSQKDVQETVNREFGLVLDAVEESLKMMKSENVLQPDKISQIFDVTNQNRINCMPSTILDIQTCGVKWVSVFPSNQKVGLKNVEGYTLLSDTKTGGIKCFMNATACTSLRTAAVGALAAKYLARKESTAIGFIGAGEEARAHFEMIKYVFPQIKTCFVSARTDRNIKTFIGTLSEIYQDVCFVNCHNNYEEASAHSDIIVTAISSQEQVLKADWVHAGMLYIHVAGLEDEFGVVEKADKIICDEWESVKHRTQTISQMYVAGRLCDEDIYCDLVDLLTGEKIGRESEDEFIYFNSVGLSVEDIMLANRIYLKAVENQIGSWLEK